MDSPNNSNNNNNNDNDKDDNNNNNTFSVEDTILAHDDDGYNDNDNYVHIPTIRKKCDRGHWHKMKDCIWCGCESVIYREQDVFDKNTFHLLPLDIETSQEHWCLSKKIIREFYPTLSWRQILNPEAYAV